MAVLSHGSWQNGDDVALRTLGTLPSSGTAIIAKTKTIQTGLIILNAASVKPYAVPATKYASLSPPVCGSRRNALTMLRYPVAMTRASRVTPVHPRFRKTSR